MPTSPPEPRWFQSGLFALAGLFVFASGVFAQSEKAPQKQSDPVALARGIDAAIQKQLELKKLPVSPRTDDAEFLRRVSLDIAGVIPTAEQAAAFLDSTAADKRARLIDDLLASPEHARQMTDLWKELLLPKTAESLRRDHLPIIRWLNRSFADNKPWDKLFHELLTAHGMQEDSPGTTFFVVHESVDMLTDRVSRVLLGVQLQCAQCHDHPFASWKRDEYWALAGFFTKVGRLYQRTPQAGERYGASEEVKKPLMLPDSARKVPPRFLRGEQPKLDPSQPYLPVLAGWLTAPDNPYFARALVNRIWFHYFGRGLVNPVDGMNPENPATHPELLDLLTREFVASGFDARFLMRALCLSETYQRSSRPVPGSPGDQQLYSRMPMRVLTPFQLHDSWELVVRIGDPKRAEDHSDPKVEKRIHGSRNGFANFFAPEEGSLPTEYKAGIPQALRMMNARDSTRIARAATVVRQQAKDPPERITRSYLMTVSRRPRPEEMSRMTRFVEQHGDQVATYTDILWTLLNTTEFITNH